MMDDSDMQDPSNLKEDPVELARICAESAWEQLGPGDKTPTDISYYFICKFYPARSVDDLEIDVAFSLTAKTGLTLPSAVIRIFPASKLTTFSKLLKETKELWRFPFQKAQAPFPAKGVWPKNLTVMFVETHGDAKGTWKSARDAERYEKWYYDNVTHGRCKSLKLELCYVEEMEE